jgi:hypothetical protein
MDRLLRARGKASGAPWTSDSNINALVAKPSVDVSCLAESYTATAGRDRPCRAGMAVCSLLMRSVTSCDLECSAGSFPDLVQLVL